MRMLGTRCRWIALCALTLGTAAHAAEPVSPRLPIYDLAIHLDVERQRAEVCERLTWTNPLPQPVTELVFNDHAHFQLADADVGFLAKMAEIVRLQPGEALDQDGPVCTVASAHLLPATPAAPPADLPFAYRPDNATALVVTLPRPVGPGQTITLDLQLKIRLPTKQGRWGRWKGVTTLCNWLPVLAFRDATGWQPTPFIAWHQPFFNEAGLYRARVRLPANQKLACTAPVRQVTDAGDGWQEVSVGPCPARDFALVCSDRFRERVADAGPVKVRCLAFPEHEYYAKVALDSACRAVLAYSQWFGPCPTREFTVVETYLGWNGNEAGGLALIDQRVFTLPHLGRGYVEYLVAHETCHQWWYNAVGTNGYAETFMDEGLATYFAHRLLNEQHGKNNSLLEYPAGLQWLPRIDREDYAMNLYYGIVGRGEAGPTVQDLPKYGHLVNLCGMAYERGSKVMGMIEDRLGESAFIDFMRLLYRRYYFRILRVADLQRELEAYTGRSWDEFFRRWVYGGGLTDWKVESVRVDAIARRAGGVNPLIAGSAGDSASHQGADAPRSPCRVTLLLKQCADYNEPTVLGFAFADREHYTLRLPIVPRAGVVEIDDPPARIVPLDESRVRVEVALPARPTQIAVDPDQVLLDRNPANNYWKPNIRFRFRPLYTFLDETDLTSAYDAWNLYIGPWLYDATYNDPWFTRATVVGLRGGVYRTQQFEGGVYTGWRPDYRDWAAGADGVWMHWPWPQTQVGFNIERSLAGLDNGGSQLNRNVLYARYVFDDADSLYLPPMHYLESFAATQNNYLPIPYQRTRGARRFDSRANLGLHHHIDYLTPYWDPEGGFKLDTTLVNGYPIPKTPYLDPTTALGRFRQSTQTSYQATMQGSFVQSLPDGLRRLSDTRFAFRLYGATALPADGQFYSLGGNQLFRGFDLAERQGSQVWVGSVEWRLPLVRQAEWDACDHLFGVRNVYVAPFCDVGNAYVSNRPLGPIAQAGGVGLRVDMAWLSFVERTTLRFDVAKTWNANTPAQFWFGLQHPF